MGARSRWTAAGLCLLATLSARSDPLLDFSLFEVPPSEQQAQQIRLMRWLVREDAEQFCGTVAFKDGYASRSGACVYWQLNTGTCVMVTTSSTTHSQLGHLFLHCLRGK